MNNLEFDGLQILWNGEKIGEQDYTNLLKELGKETVKAVLGKYKTARIKAKDTVMQNLVMGYKEVVVEGGYNDGQAFQKQVDEIEDARKYVKYVDECLKVLPGMYKTIIIEDFVRGRDDIIVYIDLGLPKSTYYYMKADAIVSLMSEFVYRSIIY